jgi:hypothetical protein
MLRSGRLIAGLAALSWITLACSSSIQMASSYEQGADFSQYHTFGFLKDRQLGEPYRQALAERTIANILAKKGLRFDPAKPDLLIGLTPFVDPTMSGTNVPAGTLMWTPVGPPVGASISTGGTISVPAEITMTFQDVRTGHIVWEGTGKGRADLDNPKETSDRVVQTITMLLENYPPKTK